MVAGAVRVEVCVDAIESALAAQRGGAHRIELCANLVEGGTTPSAGMLRECRRQLDIPIHVLIRPRGGDFLYTEAEIRVMLADIAAARDAGADGVVVGALQADGRIDRALVARLIAAADGLAITFHRAFDVTPDWESSLQDVISLGAHRVLSSGQARNAPDGALVLSKMRSTAGDRLVVLPGGGIDADNVETLVRQTGATEVHLTGAALRSSAMTYRAPHVEIGNAPPRSEYAWAETHERIIRDVVTALGHD